MLETVDVTDPRAAAVFCAPRQRRILLALIEQERSLSQLAGLTGAQLNLLHHHIGKFVSLGLVRIARVEPRAGAPIKYYRATAREFFVPAELMDAAPGARSTLRLRELLEQSLAGLVKGAVYSSDGQGPRVRLVRHPGPQVLALDIWRELTLNETEAAALAAELHTVLRRYPTSADGGGRQFVVHAAIAPV